VTGRLARVTGDTVVPACPTDSHHPRLATLVTDAEEAKFRKRFGHSERFVRNIPQFDTAEPHGRLGGRIPYMTGGTRALLLS
jgi:hypothetical protein